MAEWFETREEAFRALADVLLDEPDFEDVVYVTGVDVTPSGIQPNHECPPARPNP